MSKNEHEIQLSHHHHHHHNHLKARSISASKNVTSSNNSEVEKVYNNGFVGTFKKFKDWVKTIFILDKFMPLICLISLIVNILLFLLLKNLLDYYDTWKSIFCIFSCDWVENLLILSGLVLISYLGKKILTDDYIICKSLIGCLSACVLLLLDGLLSSVFNSNDEKLKTVLSNSGGSPKVKAKWLDTSLSRYLAFIFFVLLIIFIDFNYDNILNIGYSIPVGKGYVMKYTFGLLLIIFFFFWSIYRFSTLGVKISRLCVMFCSLGIFKFFLDKVPGTLQENLFTNISSSHWFSVENNRLYANKKLDCLLLPGHRFFFGLGRLLQVLIRILFLALGLFIFIFLIFAIFNFMLNYINSDQFGDSSFSFYEVVKDNLSFRSLISNLLNDTVFSKIIVKNEFSKTVLVSILDNKFKVDSDHVSLTAIVFMFIFNMFLCVHGYNLRNI